MNDQLPEIFMSLVGRVNYVQKITDNEYHSSCPRCGGEPHEDGSYPNRFIMWVVSRQGTPFGMCRKSGCGYKWSPTKEDAHWTYKERIEFARKARLLEIEYLKKKTEELNVLAEKIRQQDIYTRYWEEARKRDRVMNEYAKMGIPADWVDYLRFGYIPEYKVTGRNSTYKAPAFTFPVWSLNRVENIKVRVENPISKDDRYRNIYKSGCQHLFTPLHEADKFGNKILIAEGEKKATVIHISGGLPDDVQVVGLQSVSPEKRIISMLKGSKAEVFYIALDPDAYVKGGNGIAPAVSLANQLGESRCRLVIPPKDTKFDDAILMGFRFKNAFNMAIKPEKL